eukprot:gene42802-53413_t
MTVPSLREIIDNFDLLDEWDDRYRYLIELGRTLDPMPEAAHNEDNKVRGCASQVWLETHIERADGEPVLRFLGDSDAHIVRGLVALALSIFSGKPARQILETDASAVFESLDLASHLSAQRANGVRSMIDRIRTDARAALTEA